jgi:hypothetical protein
MISRIGVRRCKRSFPEGKESAIDLFPIDQVDNESRTLRGF